MKNDSSKRIIKTTAIRLPVCSGWLVSANTASAISTLVSSNRFTGIKLRIDAMTPKPEPLGWQAGGSFSASARFCMKNKLEE